MMASPTSSASCPSCSDTPLGITTSVITFLTFLYALTVGLIYYYGLAKSSPEEIQKFIRALSGSLQELDTLGEELIQILGFDPLRAEDEDKPLRKMRVELDTILDKLKEQIDSLQYFTERLYRYGTHYSQAARWLKRASRMYYLIIREELQQKVVEKDRLMTELRHIYQRALKINSNRVEKAFWKEQHEILEHIRAERVEDAKSQAIYRMEQENTQAAYRSKQENMQLEQRQMLDSILRRVTSLEAGERTITQGETSSPDPPPASTD